MAHALSSEIGAAAPDVSVTPSFAVVAPSFHWNGWLLRQTTQPVQPSSCAAQRAEDAHDIVDIKLGHAHNACRCAPEQKAQMERLVAGEAWRPIPNS